MKNVELKDFLANLQLKWCEMIYISCFFNKKQEYSSQTNVIELTDDYINFKGLHIDTFNTSEVMKTDYVIINEKIYFNEVVSLKKMNNFFIVQTKDKTFNIRKDFQTKELKTFENICKKYNIKFKGAKI